MSISSQSSTLTAPRRRTAPPPANLTPEALLLDSFPIPPSFVPPSTPVSARSASPGLHYGGPPLSLPPSAPLPPVPGPSPVAASTVNSFRRRSARISMVESLADLMEREDTGLVIGKSMLKELREVETRVGGIVASSSTTPPLSSDVPKKPNLENIMEEKAKVRTSRANSITFPSGTPNGIPKRKPSQQRLQRLQSRSQASSAPDGHMRSSSPDLSTLLIETTKLRPARSASRLSNGAVTRSSSGSGSSSSVQRPPSPDDDDDDYGIPLDDVGIAGNESDSDSSIDLHTPLPHLMLRHGLLSPHSKLLPETSRAKQKPQQTKKEFKDERDTVQRRVRHRDGRQLRAGMGLTTGLGWSDSEDEDAPSPLTRRLSTLDLSRSRSTSTYSNASTVSTTHTVRTVASSASLRSVSRVRAPPTAWGPTRTSAPSGQNTTPSSGYNSRRGSAESSSTGVTSPLARSPTTPSHATPTVDLEKGLPPLPRHNLSLRRKTGNPAEMPIPIRSVSDNLGVSRPDTGSIKSALRESVPSNRPAATSAAALAAAAEVSATARLRARTISTASGLSVSSTKAAMGHGERFAEPPPPMPVPPIDLGSPVRTSLRQSPPETSVLSSPTSSAMPGQMKPLRLSQSHVSITSSNVLQSQAAIPSNPMTPQQSVLKYNRNQSTPPSAAASAVRVSSPTMETSARNQSFSREPVMRPISQNISDAAGRPTIGFPRPLMPRTGTGMTYRTPTASSGVRALRTASMTAASLPSGSSIGVAL